MKELEVELEQLRLQVSQETGGKGNRLMSEILPPSEKAAGQNVMEGIYRKNYSETVMGG